MGDNTVTLYAGSVEYDLEEAQQDIDSMIEALQSAKSEGATHVVLLSGNYRGAKYIRLRARYDWLSDEEGY